jgi:hypothetical protein
MRRLLTRNATPGGDPPRRRRHLPIPSAGLMVAIVALVVAVSGSAYAASTLGKNSVGTKQLKKGAVTSKKIKANAVTSGKIKPGSIGSKKLKSTLVVPNANHANTADNATNATTASNATALAKVTYLETTSITASNAPAAGTPASTFGAVNCPTGTQAIGGGFFTSSTGEEISESQPSGATATKPATGWEGFIDNFNTAGTQTFNVWAICTPVTAGSTPAQVAPITGPVPPH